MTDAARRELSDAAADVMDLESVRATFPDWRVYHVSGKQSDKEPSFGAGPAIHTPGRTECQ
jgi:hypothetical protein